MNEIERITESDVADFTGTVILHPSNITDLKRGVVAVENLRGILDRASSRIDKFLLCDGHISLLSTHLSHSNIPTETPSQRSGPSPL